jgi:amino-acid N-acetyltransferase
MLRDAGALAPSRKVMLPVAMSTPAAIRDAAASDLPDIRRLLEGVSLPTSDLARSLPVFIVASEGTGLVGVCGLELHGEAGLLRSLVVTPDRRGHGLGQALVDAVESAARRGGVRELVLLTETAHDFFTRLGYADIPRERAPEAVRVSAEFRSLCPESARCMLKRLA